MWLGACAPFEIFDSRDSRSGEYTGPAGDYSTSTDDFFEVYDPDKNYDLLPYRENSTEGRRYKPFPRDNEVDDNEYVNYWVYYYSETSEGRGDMKDRLQRSTRYIYLLKDILQYGGLSSDMVFMPMVESGFIIHGESEAGALGLWQFLRGTARDFGLIVNSRIGIDDRLDFVLSTKAAIKYLKFLYYLFDDWFLAMAGYHCGQETLQRAINKYNTRDLWELTELKALGKRSRNYVPKILAMRKIALEPCTYDFCNLKRQRPLNYQVMALQSSSSLSDIADYLDVSYEEMKQLNPRFTKDYVSVKDQEVKIRVPAYVQVPEYEDNI